jgi:signal transduction histidine kinase
MNTGFEFDKKDSSILIVDDHAYMVKILEEILKKEGYKCYPAYDAKQAHQVLSENLTDLILLDIMMPDEDGFEFCKKLKNNPRTAEIPVIFISAKIEIEDKINGFNLGGVDYITKPFNPVEVSARVATHIQLKKSKDFIKNYNDQLEQIIDVRTRELIKTEKQAVFGQLIQGIIHNIRGPVASVISSFSLIDFYREDIEEYLKDKPELLNELNEKFKEIWEVIEHDDKMLNNLLKTIDNMMVKSRSDKSIEVEIIDLNEIIRQEVEFMNADMLFNKIEKNISLIDKPLNVKAIPGEISQVFSNILKNSLDAMYERKNSLISISTGITGNFAWFAITDNGAGIPANIIHKIFDPFYTTKKMKSEENSKAPTGTGIGLHYCRQTVESYGGKIEVHSKEGEGATFTISLPIAKK